MRRRFGAVALLLLFADITRALSCFYCANGQAVNASLNSFYFTGNVDQCWPSVVDCLPIERWCLFALVYGQHGSNNVSFSLSGCTTDPTAGWRPCERHRVSQPSISVSITTCQCPWNMCNNASFRSDALRISRTSRTTIRLPTAAPLPTSASPPTSLTVEPVAAFCTAQRPNVSFYSRMALVLLVLVLNNIQQSQNRN